MRRLPQALIASVLLAFCAPLSAVDTPATLGSEAVIFPKGSPEQRARAATEEADDFPLIAVLGIAGALAAGGFYLLKKGNLSPRSSAQGTRLSIEETRPLGNKQFLAVASYGEKKILLSVCQGRIDLLCRLDDGTPNTDATAQLKAD